RFPPFAETPVRLEDPYSQLKIARLNPFILCDCESAVNSETRRRGLVADCASSQALNACGVETPTRGIAITQGQPGRSSKGNTSSPRPEPRTVPPSRNNGTSEPTSSAIFSFS